MINSKAFIALLREVYEVGDFALTVRSYSGRGMFGKECVAVETDLDAWTLALAMADINNGELDLFGLGKPRQDSMGLGTVLYWPHMEWPLDAQGFGSGEIEEED
jgi:hypothetical protein